jgi:hypothetical protein
MASPTRLPHVAIPISCPHCKQEQIVHIHARTGFLQIADQTVRCANAECGKYFDVLLPDEIIGGPFLK